MATGTQVPWTTPGGTPCCCDSCFNTLTDTPIPTYAQGYWQTIADADYSALLAGGTYSAAIDMDLQSVSTGYLLPPPTRSEQQTANQSGLAFTLAESTLEGCFLRLVTTSEISLFGSTSPGFVTACPRTVISPYSILFTRALANVDGEKYINLSSVSSGGQTWDAAFQTTRICDILVFGNAFYFLFGNVSEQEFISAGSRPRKFVNATTTMNCIVGGNTYSQQGIVGGEFLSTNNMNLNNMNGYANFTVTFTPSAP